MSTIQLSPYVNFQGRAREAMEFYHTALGGVLDLSAADGGGASRPAGPEDRIMLARLQSGGALIFATDGHPDYPAKVGESMAITLSGTDREQLIRLSTALAEGGVIKAPLSAQPGGSDIGWFSDKFGINWMVTLEKE